MNFQAVWLVFLRELRDLLRDRRMLMLYVILPVLIYPIVGLAVFQMSQFIHETPVIVEVIGVEELPAEIPLIEDLRSQKPKPFYYFHKSLFSDEEKQELVYVFPRTWEMVDSEETPQRLPQDIDLRITFPKDFAQKLREFQQAVLEPDEALPEIPEPTRYVDTSKEASLNALKRVNKVLDRYSLEFMRQNLINRGVRPEALDYPFKAELVDVAEAGTELTAIWAKIFPLLMMVWGLTGAFHPAVDLCAGEKERGTLETLLCSPAGREEIVWGKLLTVVAYSMGTVIMNLLSMALTGIFLLSTLEEFGPPPALSILWIGLALGPVTLFFGALCLSLAAFARTTSEGHYYMMPLFMVALPLVMLPLAPSAELTLGYSLIPIAGLILVLRILIEGDIATALPYLVPAMAVTLVCAYLSTRWAVYQFNQEAVLFRAGEKVNLKGWLLNSYRQRGTLPPVGASLVFGVVLTLAFYGLQVLLSPSPAEGESVGFGFFEFFTNTLLTQISVAVLAIGLAFLFSRSVREALLLRLPSWQAAIGAVLLALCVHPLVILGSKWISQLFPPNENLEAAQQLLTQALEGQPWWLLWILIGLTPAICEELIFRGFVLSGFRKRGLWLVGLVMSSILFGLAHGILQQAIMAMIVGCLIAWIVIRSGSLFVGMLYHCTHNSLMLLVGGLDLIELSKEDPWLRQVIVQNSADGSLAGFQYQGLVVLVGLVGAALLLWYPFGKRADEPD